MSESQKVLSSFTRKLANCRSSVAVKNLIDYFEGGKYGYSIEDGIPDVITNDYAFADDVANLVNHIRAIFKSPRLFLRKENIIQNVSVATKMDVESTQATYRDDKNWKVDGKELHPELVHTFAYEDNYAIYENRFVCALVDAVYDVVSKKINQLCWNFKTLNDKIKWNKETPFNSVEFLRYSAAFEDVPVLIANNSPEVGVVGSLIKSKKRLQSLRSRELYIQCKKAEKFSLKSVKSTNILTFDADYNFCYNFYVNYLYREPVLATPKQMYLNFINVNLFRAITLCGYDLVDDNTNISVSNSIKLRYEEVAFANDLFTIRVCPTEGGDLMIKVMSNPDFNESIFMLRVVNKDSVREQHLFTSINDYARELNANKEASVMREFLVSDYSPVTEINAFYVEPSSADALKKLQEFVRNCTMLAEGSFYIHSRICPVCGSNLVSPDGNDYLCARCDSIYHIFGFGAKMYLWLKQLPDVKTGPELDEKGEPVAKVAPYRVRLRVEQPEDEAEETFIDELPNVQIPDVDDEDDEDDLAIKVVDTKPVDPAKRMRLCLRMQKKADPNPKEDFDVSTDLIETDEEAELDDIS